MADEDPDTGTFDYCSDRYTWSQRQTKVLRQHNLDVIDRSNVSTEIEKISSNEWISCLNRCCWLIELLLLIEYYPAERDLIQP